MNRLIACLLILFFPVLAIAQDVVDEPDEVEVRRYTVEVVIFRYAEDVGIGSELFLPDEPEEPKVGDEPDGLEEVIDEPELAVEPAEETEEEPEPLPDTELVLLEEENYELTETYERLQRLEAYEPLMHFGWVQAAWPEEQTEAIALHLFGRPPPELDGSLMLYLGRYLHLVVDLQLRAPEAETGEVASASEFDGYAPPPDVAGDIIAPPVFYRINENRILRTGELRYYDHPKFGLLAKVKRIEEEEQTEEGELLGYPIQ